MLLRFWHIFPALVPYHAILMDCFGSTINFPTKKWVIVTLKVSNSPLIISQKFEYSNENLTTDIIYGHTIPRNINFRDKLGKLILIANRKCKSSNNVFGEKKFLWIFHHNRKKPEIDLRSLRILLCSKLIQICFEQPRYIHRPIYQTNISRTKGSSFIILVYLYILYRGRTENVRVFKRFEGFIYTAIGHGWIGGMGKN